MELLNTIWQTNFPGHALAVPHEYWRRIGFQNSDPFSDFRGGGLASLEHLANMATNYTVKYQQMLGESSSYSFAITSINVTYALIVYFQLNTASAPPSFSTCSNTELTNFSNLLQLNSQVFPEFHYYSMVFVHKKWLSELAANPNLTLMDFGRVMEKLPEVLRRVMGGENFSSILKWRVAMESEINRC